jgi:uncharacterized phage protein gp47/JayE
MATSTIYTSQQAAILASMIAYLQNPSNWPDGVPKLTDFTPGSIIYTLLAATSVGVDALGLAIFMCRNAAYISTATGTDLDNKVADYGLTRKAAVAASGTFAFYKNNAAASNIVIPSGSLISTIPDSSGNVVTFATNTDATLIAGTSSINVNATCQAKEAAGNLAAGTNLLVSSAIPGIDGVTLSVSITNGTDTETDTELSSRGLDAFLALAHGTATSYQQTVLGIAGIESAIVVPQDRGPGTVDIYVGGPHNSIPSSIIVAEAQALITSQKVATDDVAVLTPTIVVVAPTIMVHLAAGYDPIATIAAVQTAEQNYIENLGIGGGILGYVYASQLVAVALAIQGVLNATTTFNDTQILPYQLPQAGVITVTTM